MENVRILLADDHEIVRHGLRRLLETQPGWNICGEAGSGREAVEKTWQLKPDIVILDHSMPELSGAEAARQILKALPQMEIVILTMHDSEQLLREVLEAGVHGYVLKSDAMCDMVAAINALLDHKRYLSPGASGVAVEGFLHSSAEAEPIDRLTPREREIVQLLAKGKSNKEVASALNISVKTVEAHRANIMHKLNLPSFADLVHYAIRTGIVEP
ncbi:MAG TPA: response regulator transcription factor [Terriglobia bacterium]|nr:response regulator transcription factor [Terriglobia bacterium]